MPTEQTPPAPPIPAGASLINTRKIFANPAEAPPFPVFINAVDVIGIGHDVMLDVGVISPEDVNSATATGMSPPLIDMHVITRFAMSVATVALLHQRLIQILSQLPIPESSIKPTEESRK